MGMSTPNTLSYHGVSNPSKFPALAIVFSVTFHAALLMALDRPWVRPAKVKEIKELPSDFVMVNLKDDDPPDVPKALDDPPAAPSTPVPALAEVPVVDLRPIDFTQEIVVTPPSTDVLTRLDTIPKNIRQGPNPSDITKVFNPGDLDKKPEAVSQTAPTFPFELQREVSEATVRVGFIVNSRGDVVSPHILSSSHSGFERSALSAIGKWKFRPGMKQGKKVNTLVEQELTFVLTDQH
jgi:protein TonB